MPAYGPTLIQDLSTSRSALVSTGYCASVNSAQFVALQLLWPVVKVSTAQFDNIRDACTKPQAIDAAVAAVPSRIPLTVQGASEDFIETTMGKVVANTNTVGSQLSAVGAIYRDQINAKVTSEADRIIAAN